MAHDTRRDIVVIGASGGGLEALMAIVAGLPKNLPATLFVVVHIPSEFVSQLPEILTRTGALRASHVRGQEKFERGHIYVAPPDFHLLLCDGSVRVVRGPKENNHRPAIDPLFRTAAQIYGPRSIGVVLSGLLDDGAAGLFAIKKRGGIAIVQDPDDALFPDMPTNALAAAPVDYSVPKDEIAKVIISLTHSQGPTESGAVMGKNNKDMQKEAEIAAMKSEAMDDDDKPGMPSVYGCPDCGGTLWELQDDEWLRFRCRVGHAYSAEGLLRSQSEALDSALWSAFRALHENAALAHRLAQRARENNHISVAEKFEERSRRGEEEAEIIRSLLMKDPTKTNNETGETEDQPQKNHSAGNDG